VDNAPAEVVDKERARVAEMEAALKRLEEQLERVRAIT
jgi:valyl-tRNA synthetase